MKLEIVRVLANRCADGRMPAIVPPLTALHLAALVPNDVEVAVRRERASTVHRGNNADLVRSRSSPAWPGGLTPAPPSRDAPGRR
jgi:hypothetical protein